MNTVEELVKIFRVVLNGAAKKRGWVLFENGTIVIIRADKTGDLKEMAIEILKEYGPVYPGGPAGDIDIIECEDLKGGVLITGHHPDVLTYVSRTELGGKPGLVGALHGRGKRHKDGTELIVVHVEQKDTPETTNEPSESVSDSEKSNRASDQESNPASDQESNPASDQESNPASDPESNPTSEPESNQSPSKSKRVVNGKRKRNNGSSETKTSQDLTEKRSKVHQTKNREMHKNYQSGAG